MCFDCFLCLFSDFCQKIIPFNKLFRKKIRRFEDVCSIGWLHENTGKCYDISQTNSNDFPRGMESGKGSLRRIERKNEQSL